MLYFEFQALNFPENSNSFLVFLQYYYAHASTSFNTDGAKHFEGDGKIYGGDPVLIRKATQEERQMTESA